MQCFVSASNCGKSSCDLRTDGGKVFNNIVVGTLRCIVTYIIFDVFWECHGFRSILAICYLALRVVRQVLSLEMIYLSRRRTFAGARVGWGQ